MKRNKSDIIALAFALILIVIVFVTIFILLNNEEPTQQPTTTTPTASSTSIPTPTPVLITNKDGVVYNVSDENKIRDLAENRRLLTDDDIQAKDKLLEELFAERPSGYLYQSENVKIEYLNPNDEFAIEVMTTNIDKAKKEAVEWFLSKSISRDGICKLPISFFPNPTVSQYLSNSGIVFSPLSPGC